MLKMILLTRVHFLQELPMTGRHQRLRAHQVTKPVIVVVTYPDGTKDEVLCPVTVGEQAALYFHASYQDVPAAKQQETPAASQGIIANRGTLPGTTTIEEAS